MVQPPDPSREQQARERMTEINQQREGLQLKVRERERAIEAGRQVILRLLGEASTLKNQLAQIDEYLAQHRGVAFHCRQRGDFPFYLSLGHGRLVPVRYESFQLLPSPQWQLYESDPCSRPSFPA